MTVEKKNKARAQSGSILQRKTATCPFATTKKADCINIVSHMLSNFQELVEKFERVIYMQNFLRDVYEGAIRPNERRFAREQGYKEALGKYANYEDAFISRLNEEWQDLYKNLGIAIPERELYEDIQAFSNAFGLGANIMMVCLTERECDRVPPQTRFKGFNTHSLWKRW